MLSNCNIILTQSKNNCCSAEHIACYKNENPVMCDDKNPVLNDKNFISADKNIACNNKVSVCCKNKNFTCCSSYSQLENVSVSVGLKTFANVGEIKTECCGGPSVCITSCKKDYDGCDYNVVITQTICTKIPIEYCTQANVGETIVQCKCNN
ncbi:MAG: hypothetical protein RR140_03495 [Clostridia bacterium]